MQLMLVQSYGGSCVQPTLTRFRPLGNVLRRMTARLRDQRGQSASILMLIGLAYMESNRWDHTTADGIISGEIRNIDIDGRRGLDSNAFDSIDRMMLSE